MTTIKQVALEAGVSKSTVSRFIAQNGYVSDEAREKIERAIKKLNYRPNLSAQSLKTKTCVDIPSSFSNISWYFCKLNLLSLQL